jgi:hypothetical protein
MNDYDGGDGDDWGSRGDGGGGGVAGDGDMVMVMVIEGLVGVIWGLNLALERQSKMTSTSN